jgi:hypothetical protein
MGHKASEKCRGHYCKQSSSFCCLQLFYFQELHMDGRNSVSKTPTGFENLILHIFLVSKSPCFLFFRRTFIIFSFIFKAGGFSWTRLYFVEGYRQPMFCMLCVDEEMNIHIHKVCHKEIGLTKQDYSSIKKCGLTKQDNYIIISDFIYWGRTQRKNKLVQVPHYLNMLVAMFKKKFYRKYWYILCV